MSGPTDLVIFGTGNFAARILFDFTATASKLGVTIVGRDARRLAWLRTAGAARAAMFNTGVRVAARILDPLTSASAVELLAELRPSVVFNTASAQGGRIVTDQPDRWTLLVQEGGLGVAAVLQAHLSLDVARAIATAVPDTRFVNGCYPDVVNAMIRGAGLPVICGIGNVAILAHAFAGTLGPEHGRLQLLAQHAALAAFRRPPHERATAIPPRVWLNGAELPDVFERFAAVQLAREPVIDISGASGVPLFIAMINGRPWHGHAPGPDGLPGGYPVCLNDGALMLDLPPGLSREQAITWNASFEEDNGVVVEPDGGVRFTGKVQEALGSVSRELAAGFSMADFDAAVRAFSELRKRLQEH